MVAFSGKPAAIYSISPSQLGVQAPSGISGTVPVVVTSNGSVSASFDTTVVANAPSLFYFVAGANLYAAATHADGTLIGDPAVMPNSSKASPGETIVLYVNGLAASPSGITISTPVAYSGDVEVIIGAGSSNVTYAGLVAAGEYQINVTIPKNLNASTYEITVSTMAQRSPSGVLLPVQ
jgi:uncharacterized protein (TIGR03437 family)